MGLRSSRRNNGKRLCTDDISLGNQETNEKKKLLILDVNGLLADVVSDPKPGYEYGKKVANKAVFKRAFSDEFLQFCFDNFNVEIWSSRTRRNLDSIVDYILGEKKHKLLFCWHQDHCTDYGHVIPWENNKPLVFKELKKLWDKEDPTLPWENGDYDESNTLLIDDSPHNALLNPSNTAIFPVPYTYLDVEDTRLAPGGFLHEYLQSVAKADHVQKYVEENGFRRRPITHNSVLWRFYAEVLEGTVIGEPKW